MLYSSIINDGSFVLILSVAILDAGPPNHGNQMMTVSVFQDIHAQASTLHMNLAVVGFLGTSGSFVLRFGGQNLRLSMVFLLLVVLAVVLYCP